MRLPTKTLSLFILAFFISASLLLAPQSRASYEPPSNSAFKDLLTKNKSLQDYGKEFCDKRSGDLMNLETWYSGKCGKDVDTLSGDGVGFVDIITLQGIESLIGPQQKGFLDQLIDTMKLLLDINNIIGSNNGQTLDQKLADIKNLNSTSNSGLLSQVTKITGSILIAKPAGSADYLAYISSNLKNHHVISQAYAAGPGYGFTALSPILPIWRAFRNIAYMLFALAFVLYGIMIMFRVRIDAKTAATVQLAIPKLIATLLLITFSYAIVGFLVDISTVFTGLVVNLLAIGDNNILNLSSFGKHLVSGASGTSSFGALGSLFINTIIALVITPFVLVSIWAGPITGIMGSVVGLVGLSGYGIIIGIILFLAILFSYVKLILKLFQAFLSVIINLIFAPIVLLGNILPGSTSFGDWLRSIYGNLAVFPVAVFFLTISYALMVQPFFGTIPGIIGNIPGYSNITSNILGVRPLSTGDGIWSPPMTFPFVGPNGDMVLAAIGLGLLLMASKYCEMVEKALKTPPFPYGAAIGEALKAGVNINQMWADKSYKGTGPLRGYINKSYQKSGGDKIKQNMDSFSKM